MIATPTGNILQRNQTSIQCWETAGGIEHTKGRIKRSVANGAALAEAIT